MPLASISKVTSICGTPLLAGGIPSPGGTGPEIYYLWRHLRSPLYHVDIHCRLIIRRCGEDLALLGRNRGISLDQRSGNAAHGLNGQGQRSYIQQKHIPCAGVSLPACLPVRKRPGPRTHPGSESCWAHVRSAVLLFPAPPGYGWIRLPAELFQAQRPVMPASDRALVTGSAVSSTRSWVNSSNFAPLVRSQYPDVSDPRTVAVIKGRLMLVVEALDSSFFAFSAASLILCMAILSLERSIPSFLLELGHNVVPLPSGQNHRRPDGCFRQLPETSMTPSPISMIDTSKVPPPRS